MTQRRREPFNKYAKEIVAAVQLGGDTKAHKVKEASDGMRRRLHAVRRGVTNRGGWTSEADGDDYGGASAVIRLAYIETHDRLKADDRSLWAAAPPLQTTGQTHSPPDNVLFKMKACRVGFQSTALHIDNDNHYLLSPTGAAGKLLLESDDAKAASELKHLESRIKPRDAVQRSDWQATCEAVLGKKNFRAYCGDDATATDRAAAEAFVFVCVDLATRAASLESEKANTTDWLGVLERLFRRQSMVDQKAGAVGRGGRSGGGSANLVLRDPCGNSNDSSLGAAVAATAPLERGRGPDDCGDGDFGRDGAGIDDYDVETDGSGDVDAQ